MSEKFNTWITKAPQSYFRPIFEEVGVVFTPSVTGIANTIGEAFGKFSQGLNFAATGAAGAIHDVDVTVENVTTDRYTASATAAPYAPVGENTVGAVSNAVSRALKDLFLDGVVRSALPVKKFHEILVLMKDFGYMSDNAEYQNANFPEKGYPTIPTKRDNLLIRLVNNNTVRVYTHSATSPDPGITNTHLKLLVKNFMHVWFMVCKSATPSILPSGKSFKYVIGYNGRVDVYDGSKDTNGQDAKLPVLTIDPNPGDWEKCKSENSCARLAFIMETHSRDSETIAKKAMSEMENDDRDSKDSRSITGAYSILKRLGWIGRLDDKGNKVICDIHELPKDVREMSGQNTLLADVLTKMFNNGAGAVPVAAFAEARWSVLKSHLENKAILNHDDQTALGGAPTDWVAGAPNKFKYTPFGQLIKMCIDKVNANKEILNAHVGRQIRFVADDDTIARSRVKTLTVGHRLGYPSGLPFSGYFMSGKQYGGQEGGGSTIAPKMFSKLIRQQFDFLVGKLNAQGKTLTVETLNKFMEKIKKLEDAEKDTMDTAEIMSSYAKKSSSDPNVTISLEDMEKYQAKENEVIKKTMTLESALGKLTFKVNETESGPPTKVDSFRL